MTTQYRRKPTLVEARQFTGTNQDDILLLAGDTDDVDFKGGSGDQPCAVFNTDADRWEDFGPGDWIVREDNGSLSVVTNVQFTEQYEATS